MMSVKYKKPGAVMCLRFPKNVNTALGLAVRTKSIRINSFKNICSNLYSIYFKITEEKDPLFVYEGSICQIVQISVIY